MEGKRSFLVMKVIKRMVLFTFVFFAFLAIGEVINPTIEAEAAIFVSVNKNRVYNDKDFTERKYSSSDTGYVQVQASDMVVKKSATTYEPMGLSHIVANGYYNDIKVVGSSNLSAEAFNVCTGKNVKITGYNNLIGNEKIGEGYIKYGATNSGAGQSFEKVNLYKIPDTLKCGNASNGTPVRATLTYTATGLNLNNKYSMARGFRVSSGSILTFDHIDLSGNSFVRYSALVNVYQGQVYLNNSKIRDNFSSWESTTTLGDYQITAGDGNANASNPGGAVAVLPEKDAVAEFHMANSEITNCGGGYSGGGIHAKKEHNGIKGASALVNIDSSSSIHGCRTSGFNGSAGSWSKTTGGGNLAVLAGAVANVNGHIYGGFVDTDSSSLDGGNIYVNGEGSTVNVNSTAIINNGSAMNTGGNIYATSSGIVNLYGTVNNGAANKYGGNISLNKNATLNLNGGIIENGVAKDGHGGNVYCKNSTFTMGCDNNGAARGNPYIRGGLISKNSNGGSEVTITHGSCFKFGRGSIGGTGAYAANTSDSKFAPNNGYYHWTMYVSSSTVRQYRATTIWQRENDNCALYVNSYQDNGGSYYDLCEDNENNKAWSCGIYGRIYLKSVEGRIIKFYINCLRDKPSAVKDTGVIKGLTEIKTDSTSNGDIKVMVYNAPKSIQNCRFINEASCCNMQVESGPDGSNSNFTFGEIYNKGTFLTNCGNDAITTPIQNCSGGTMTLYDKDYKAKDLISNAGILYMRGASAYSVENTGTLKMQYDGNNNENTYSVVSTCLYNAGTANVYNKSLLKGKVVNGQNASGTTNSGAVLYLRNTSRIQSADTENYGELYLYDNAKIDAREQTLTNNNGGLVQTGGRATHIYVKKIENAGEITQNGTQSIIGVSAKTEIVNTGTINAQSSKLNAVSCENSGIINLKGVTSGITTLENNASGTISGTSGTLKSVKINNKGDFFQNGLTVKSMTGNTLDILNEGSAAYYVAKYPGTDYNTEYLTADTLTNKDEAEMEIDIKATINRDTLNDGGELTFQNSKFYTNMLGNSSEGLLRIIAGKGTTTDIKSNDGIFNYGTWLIQETSQSTSAINIKTGEKVTGDDRIDAMYECNPIYNAGEMKTLNLKKKALNLYTKVNNDASGALYLSNTNCLYSPRESEKGEYVTSAYLDNIILNNKGDCVLNNFSTIIESPNLFDKSLYCIQNEGSMSIGNDENGKTTIMDEDILNYGSLTIENINLYSSLRNEGVLLMKDGTIDGGESSALINNHKLRTNTNLVKAEIWDGTLKSNAAVSIEHHGSEKQLVLGCEVGYKTYFPDIKYKGGSGIIYLGLCPGVTCYYGNGDLSTVTFA